MVTICSFDSLPSDGRRRLSADSDEAGRSFQSEAGHRSDPIPAAIPI
jgi:hypothetical protein